MQIWTMPGHASNETTDGPGLREDPPDMDQAITQLLDSLRSNPAALDGSKCNIMKVFCWS